VGESPLTAREYELLRAARDGGTVAHIAARVHLSEGTVRNSLLGGCGQLVAVAAE
jgi:two-component system response regulator DesR